MSHPAQLTRTHRILIGVVVAGAVVIAGIGFAGSYAAVRELALHKGFGNFSYVFPIGVDAGICVLLALDLLLTWMRIPFPLLRQTAWLLTAATIAFNGAAAWPDPLGVGMHAVIPVLFVVSVEAARHAVGRIADITADKHMEGVRLTRWLLSPIPTFRLWRRMKLWELRSYEQVIKLEQDRLIYRARLQSVYGRAWRRKAPVESLMPLRLAKYGVPLAETAPAGLAAAGMEPVLLPPPPAVALERTDVPAAPSELEGESGPLLEAGQASAPGLESLVQPDSASPVETALVGEWEGPERQVDFADAVRAFAAQFGYMPDPGQLGWFLAEAYGITDPATGGSLPAAVLAPFLSAPEHAPVPEAPAAPAVEEDAPAASSHPFFGTPLHTPGPVDQVLPAQPAALSEMVPAPRPSTGSDSQPEQVPETGNETTLSGPQPSPEEQPAGDTGPAQASGGQNGKVVDQTLTVVDRYFLAWEGYIAEHGQEPTGPQLSRHLAALGILNRNGSPVAPATLRRYLLEFRIYNVWAEQRETQADPAVPAVLEELARRGITGQYNRPLEAPTVEELVVNFRRRYQVFSLDMSNSRP
ncbi:DUF2637 domain-containing protein [Streptomyces sp. NBC_01431]|uniref:DUF2637 domain-containing protein n=1 Tax=Streptomyces sp. NBC_01431 TaxID=2903863 RepID=UPI002E379CFC|nr:DUF2637 domain-containing protein [Streptomyces sp. NBC_01431]